METVSEVFEVSEEDEKKLLKFRKYTPEKIKEHVKELEEWHKKQPHLPQTFQFDDLLERAFNHCFHNIELTKNRLDLHFTYKGKNRDFYEIFGTEQFVLPSKNSIQAAILPRLYKNGERITVGYMKSIDVEKYEFDHMVQVVIACLELGFKLERARGFIAVVDCEGFDMNWMKKTDIAKFLRLTTHLHEGYITRVAGVHLLNAGSAIQFFINLCKKLVSHRLFSRLNIHDSLESLHEMIEAKYLPAEFGGTCGTMKEMMGKMDQQLLQHRNYLVECGSDKYVADESKRDTNGSTFGVDIFF